MSKQLLAISLLLFSTLTIAVAACGSASISSSRSSAGTAKEVHMNSTSFVQAALTIQKGQSVTLVNDDAFTPHIIANGAWENGTPKPAKEVGAPSVNHVQINGESSQTIGPFTTAGTFHFYCTIHPGMELAVIVQ
jgi:plastocyanin